MITSSRTAFRPRANRSSICGGAPASASRVKWSHWPNMAGLSTSSRLDVSDHLTKNDVDLYQRRSLPPTRLLALDDHLSGCEECRDRLERFANPAESVDHIR